MLVKAKQKWTRGLLISEITRSPKKKEPSGITHNIYKWALLERNSMQQNNIYNIPLPRGPGPKNQKQKGNERGINYPCGLKNLGTVV
jgi:hypothetical protein